MLRTWGLLTALIAFGLVVGFAVKPEVRVGDRTPDGIWLPTGQAVDPVGELTVFKGRPLEVLWDREGEHLLVKTISGLMVVDAKTSRVVQTLSSSTGSSMTGLALSQDGKTLLTSDSGKEVQIARRSPEGLWAWDGSISMPEPKIKGQPHPCGIDWLDADKALVALSRSNQVALISVSEKKVLQLIDVDPCPVTVKVLDFNRIAVGCWSRAAKAGEQTQSSSGTEVPVTPAGVGKGGSLVIVNLQSGAQKKLPLGLQPVASLLVKDRLYVACGSDDKLNVIDIRQEKALKPIPLEPVKGMKVGIGPNGLALSSDGYELYVSCGGLNGVAVLDLSTLKIKGWITTAWHPGGIDQKNGRLACASIKGYGSRGGDDPLKRGVYEFQGVVSNLAEPSSDDLAKWSPRVLKQANAMATKKGSKDAKPVPFPAEQGDPSLIKHVVYVIKENRTYDQVFGDYPGADGDPSLAMFGKDVTPNHRALAERFGLLDNYYCNGVNSADGHAWSVEGRATPYFERSFGGWTRSYPFGDDPLAVSGGGFIWDEVLRRHMSFRNFGEFDYAEPSKKEDYLTILRDFESGQRKVKFTQKIGVAQLRKHSSPTYPGWNMGIPDVVRAQAFIDELDQMEKKGSFPRFTIIYLPQDHHSGAQAGMPTPRAHLADNDLALGRVVEAISKSRFWKETAIFVIEDDPQGGFDHVDGHRSICLVISPYSRPGVNSTFYSQSSVIGSMRRLLGLPPLTYFDAISPLMGGCFQSTPDFRPFTALKNTWPLDEMNEKKEGVVALDLSGPDRGMEVERNRQAWFTVFPGKRFPTEVLGPHGRGLASRGLVHGEGDEEEEED